MTCCIILLILLLVCRENVEQLVERSYVFKTKYHFSSGNNQKRIRRSKRCPGQGQRADLMGLRISKEDTLLSPGAVLREQGEAVPAERMEGMSNGKAMFTIRVIRCS
ncbi:hypothetical protein KSB_61180 [Ktedonobacter robiniae]|uniref:Secreted protein n=1 Tax=Ktedonobacter robiniae TaxID=2778365 RepID=A0ABQ3UXZ3_9CHLR|nr:hypothetical protein KSB_61180 [Ktedonobacter robiniae]